MLVPLYLYRNLDDRIMIVRRRMSHLLGDFSRQPEIMELWVLRRNVLK